MPDEESVEMQETVRELVALEAGSDYKQARGVIQDRNDLRRTLRELAAVEARLPQASEYFVGVAIGRKGKAFKGRMDYKGLAEDLARQQEISDKDFEKMKEQYRGEPGRIMYGLRRELKEDPRQLKFSFMTPE